MTWGQCTKTCFKFPNVSGQANYIILKFNPSLNCIYIKFYDFILKFYTHSALPLFGEKSAEIIATLNPSKFPEVWGLWSWLRFCRILYCGCCSRETLPTAGTWSESSVLQKRDGAAGSKGLQIGEDGRRCYCRVIRDKLSGKPSTYRRTVHTWVNGSQVSVKGLKINRRALLSSGLAGFFSNVSSASSFNFTLRAIWIASVCQHLKHLEILSEGIYM